MDKQILEMLALMNDKMDKGFIDLNNRMGTMEAKVDSLDAKVVTLEAKVDSLDAKVVTLEAKVDSLDAKVVTLEAKVDSLDAKVVTLEAKVDSLNAKVVTLEAKVDSLNAKVDKEFAEMTVWHGERSNESVKLLTSIDNRFDKLENDIEQLNVVTSKSVRYLKHKVMELDQEVFLLHPEQ